jgi:hypothetical protein
LNKTRSQIGAALKVLNIPVQKHPCELAHTASGEIQRRIQDERKFRWKKIEFGYINLSSEPYYIVNVHINLSN